MKDFLVLFREPDGRSVLHTEKENLQHRENWQKWMEPLLKNGNLAGGKALTLKGVMMSPDGKVTEEVYKNGTEIVGGYLLLKSGARRGNYFNEKLSCF